MTSCNGQTSNSLNSSDILKEININGDTVKELGSNIMVIYQDKKNNYWFGSWETGVYRFDGKTLINYTTKQGLYTNRVDDIKLIYGKLPFAIDAVSGRNLELSNVKFNRKNKIFEYGQ